MKVKSLKQESILKQFYLYFLVASVIPLIVLFYIIFQYASAGNVDISRLNSKVLIAIACVFSVLGFLGTRSFLTKIVSLSNKLKKQTFNFDKLDKEKILALADGDEEVSQLARAFSEIINNLEHNLKELNETKKALYQVLSNIGKAVGSAENFDALIQFILETIIEALGAKRGAIFILDERNVLTPRAIFGIKEKFVPHSLSIGESAAGWVVSQRRPLLIPLIDKEDGDSVFSSPLACAPLVFGDKTLGAICVSGKNNDKSFSEEELRILSTLAYQIAVSFENVSLNSEVEKVYFETISALALAVEAKDYYSRGHSERVAKYAVKIASNLSLPQKDLDTLRDAARLHDIGKIGISDDILHKKDKLSSEEKIIMNKHPQIGDGIVKPLKSLRHIVNPIRHHHEFLDGTGYPDGLKGEDIPMITRILTVADIFDALTTNRSYRKALSIEMTKSELDSMAQMGKIDKNVVNTLFKLIDDNQLNTQQ